MSSTRVTRYLEILDGHKTIEFICVAGDVCRKSRSCSLRATKNITCNFIRRLVTRLLTIFSLSPSPLYVRLVSVWCPTTVSVKRSWDPALERNTRNIGDGIDARLPSAFPAVYWCSRPVSGDNDVFRLGRADPRTSLKLRVRSRLYAHRARWRLPSKTCAVNETYLNTDHRRVTALTRAHTTVASSGHDRSSRRYAMYLRMFVCPDFQLSATESHVVIRSGREKTMMHMGAVKRVLENKN